MCNGPDRLNPGTPASSSSSPICATLDMNNSIGLINTEISFSSLLELAADNDVERFKQSLSGLTSRINYMGLWYGRERPSKQMVFKHRTPLMIASTYGSINVVRYILSLSEADVNCSYGPDKKTALHCAASSGSVNAVDMVKLLLLAGADPNSIDAQGHRPFDVIVAPPKLPHFKDSLVGLLRMDQSHHEEDREVSIPLVGENSNLPSHSSSMEKRTYLSHSNSEKKEYPVDPSLPDIKNGPYSTDEFRMFSFKIRPCSRAYSHDWTECPFVHAGETARRRDPRKFNYSSFPCPDFRKGQCRFGDLCEYAHGVFETWLHPTQYRTRICKDGTRCSRRVCFFAHTSDELRSLFVSTRSPFTPPMSPLGSSIMIPSMAWPKPNIPTLHLQGSNFQTSRLRSPLNALSSFPLPHLNSSCVNLYVHSKSPAPATLDQINTDMFSPNNVHRPFFKQQLQIRSPSSCDFGTNLPRDIVFSSQVKSLSNWDSPSGNVGWSVNGDELSRVRRPFLIGDNGEEPDLSWVQTLVKEPPPEIKETPIEGSNLNSQIEKIDNAFLGAWLKKMQFDQIAA